MDFPETRQKMVDCQILPEDVCAPAVIGAFLDVSRENFVPRQQQHIAYMDSNFPLGYDRFMLRPVTLAKMLQALDPQPHEKALVVGTNLGYSIALLSQMVHAVIGVESVELLSQQAEKILRDAGIKNFEVVLCDQEKGCADYGPYDVILVEGKVSCDPDALLAQLKENGRLVAITSCSGKADEVTLYSNINGHISKRPVCDGTAPFLKGFEPKTKFEF